MKKNIIISIFIIAIALFTWLRVNPPIVEGALSTNSDQTVMLFFVLNKGLHEIKIDEVTINNGRLPSSAKIQAFDNQGGYLVTTVFSTNNFQSLDETKLKKSNSKYIENSDSVYGITVANTEPIQQMTVHYHYLGMPYKIKFNVNPTNNTN